MSPSLTSRFPPVRDETTPPSLFLQSTRPENALPRLIANILFTFTDPANVSTISKEDGASGPAQGSADLEEPDYTVAVKLSDLQADPNNPLFSVKSFEDLGLQVLPTDTRPNESLTANLIDTPGMRAF